MDLTPLAKDLAEDFTEVRLEHGGGQLLVPRAPVDVAFLASEHLPDECRDDTAYEFFAQEKLLSPLVTFVWEEDRGDAFSTSIDILELDDRAYVTIEPDDAVDQEWDAFVAIENPDAGEIFDALLFDLLWDNGESYGIELFSSLPTIIVSTRLSKSSIRAALHLYLEWDDTRYPGAWLAAAELLPASLKADDTLAQASKALLNKDGDEVRDAFIEAYADAVYRAKR